MAAFLTAKFDLVASHTITKNKPKFGRHMLAVSKR